MTTRPCPLILDPEPGRVRTLLYGTPPFDYVADTAEEWAVKGFAGFIRPDVMPGWQVDVWETADGTRIAGERNPKLRACRRMNRKLREAGVSDNFIAVPFSKRLPDWFDGDGWRGLCENFRQAARFCRIAGFTGVALDDEYIEEQLGLNYSAYREPGYPFDRLREQARLRGRQIQRAMLDEFPDMVTFHLPETYSIEGELAKDLFLGYLDMLAEADAPGGMHVLPECTYFQTNAHWIAMYGYGLDRVLIDDLTAMEPRLGEYWKRRCGIALGQAPLGYLRFIRDAEGKRIGYGGRKEVFGDQIIRAGEDKSGNYSPKVFHETHAACRMASRRYTWIFSGGPVWWQMTPEQHTKYGGPDTAVIPLTPEFDEYTEPLQNPKIIDRPEFQKMMKGMREHSVVDTLEGLGMPRTWWVNGPYPNPAGKGYHIEHEPERRIDLGARSEGAWAEVGWKRVATPPMAYVDLSRLIAGGVEIQGYAATWVETDSEVDAVIRFGSDDTGKLWLNRSLIHESNTERIAVPDEDTIRIALPAGRSVFLLKIGNYRGGWGFYFRITDEDGKEIPSLRWVDGPTG